MDNLQTDLKASYNKRFKTLEKRVATAIHTINLDELSLTHIKDVTSTIIEIETSALNSELELLLEKKDALEREIEKKSDELQHKKYDIFNAMESELQSNPSVLSKLHQAKLQSIDLYEILNETVESAIITALEKWDSDGEISEAATEVIKDITYESIKEGSLNSIRVRKILSTILYTAIEVSEATPNRADKILTSTLKGMRSGFIKAIEKFKKDIAFMPSEAKHILIEDYDTIINDLHQTENLFLSIVSSCAEKSTSSTDKQLKAIHKDMSYDIEELVHISKETAEVIKEKFSNLAKMATKKADEALQSKKAQEAKRMGMQAYGVAKGAINNAIKSAKDVIDK